MHLEIELSIDKNTRNNIGEAIDIRVKNFYKEKLTGCFEDDLSDKLGIESDVKNWFKNIFKNTEKFNFKTLSYSTYNNDLQRFSDLDCQFDDCNFAGESPISNWTLRLTFKSTDYSIESENENFWSILPAKTQVNGYSHEKIKVISIPNPHSFKRFISVYQ